jgi:hypothetical protein
VLSVWLQPFVVSSAAAAPAQPHDARNNMPCSVLARVPDRPRGLPDASQQRAFDSFDTSVSGTLSVDPGSVRPTAGLPADTVLDSSCTAAAGVPPGVPGVGERTQGAVPGACDNPPGWLRGAVPVLPMRSGLAGAGLRLVLRRNAHPVCWCWLRLPYNMQRLF